MGNVAVGSRRPEPALIVKKAARRAGKPGFTIVVGTAVSKSAVKRNLVKRRLRAILRTRNGAVSFPLVIIARPASLLLSFDELAAACERALACFTVTRT